MPGRVTPSQDGVHLFLTRPSPLGTDLARKNCRRRTGQQPFATGIAGTDTPSWTEKTMDISPFPLRCAVVGRGRMGSALSSALGLDEPLGRGADGSEAEVVLLAVPDGEIAAAACAIAPGRL